MLHKNMRPIIRPDLNMFFQKDTVKNKPKSEKLDGAPEPLID